MTTTDPSTVASYIAATTAVINTITAITKALAGIRETTADRNVKETLAGVQDHVIDLQSQVFALRAEAEQLTEIKRQLKDQIRKHDNWNSQAVRYELKQIKPGIFVYALKPEFHSVEPAHWLCPSCYQRREPSIMQRPVVNHENYQCHRCKFQILEDLPLPR